MRNAKIVCTLGPSTDSRQTIESLVEAGMSVARLNTSHGTTEDRSRLIDYVHDVDSARPESVAVMLDLQGPEIRTAAIPDDGNIVIETGSTVTFDTGDSVTSDRIGLSIPINDASPGDRILLDDGLIETTVTDVRGDSVDVYVENGGELGSRKGVNVPGVDLELDVVTQRDRSELERLADREIDFVAASFVRDADDVLEVETALESVDLEVPIIAKIERAGAVENLDEILDVAYGAMVARGDLGVECPMEDVPIIQKRIIRRCRSEGIPVITATEMLDSMVHARRPTRAEASDVANAVLDGTDAVMLSAETAVGDNPIEAVETMDRIIRQVERSEEYAELLEQRVPGSASVKTEALARSARFLARDLGATAIVTATESGYTALKTAKYRPGVPVVGSTPNHTVRRRLALSWGVIPLYAPVSDQSADEVIERAVQAAIDGDIARSGDTVVVLCGMMTDLETANTTNMMKVHIAAEALATGRVVVGGRADGPIVHSADGDLADCPEGAIIALDEDFDSEFRGDLSKIAGIVDARRGLTGYPALVAREKGIPMISGVSIPDVSSGSTVTLDAERGVLYDGPIGRQRDA